MPNENQPGNTAVLETDFILPEDELENDYETTSETDNQAEQEEATNTEESKTEDDEPSFDLDSLENEDHTGDSVIVKPLDFVADLPQDKQEAYQKQLSDLSIPIQQVRELKSALGTNDYKDVKEAVSLGIQFGTFINTAVEGGHDAKVKAVNGLLDQLEARMGLSLESLIPDRLGYELSEEEKELNRVKAENEQLLTERQKLQAAEGWLKDSDAQIEAFSKFAGGFKPDKHVIAQAVAGGSKIIDAVRSLQTREWEAHLREVGRKEGLKEALRKNEPDLSDNKKGTEEKDDFYPAGHALAGMPRKKK